MSITNLTGKMFGKLRVLELAGRDHSGLKSLVLVGKFFGSGWREVGLSKKL